MEQSFEYLWNKLMARHPSLADDTAKVSIAGAQFKKLLKAFYDNGKSDQAATDKQQEQFFRNLFGGLRK
jgi:hypothetical protein